LRSYVGTPGYTTFSLYAGINVTEDATLRIGIENLTDKKYRAAHSRMDAPGISATASLEIRF
jgi:outer membrane receptor protein involved in Fe transport